MTTILLIEDNEWSRDMLSRRLSRHGFQVMAVEDGERGLLSAHSGQPDLILLDISLPDIDGWEIARRLKAHAATKPIPIIALTAHAMRGDRELALQAGCDEYDTKPVDLARLLAKIGALLDRDSPVEDSVKRTQWLSQPATPVAPDEEEI